MRRLFGLLVVVFAVSFLAAACSSGGGGEKAPTYPACSSNANCSEKGEVCVDGMCKECGKKGDCKGTCMTCKDNKCEKDASCCAGDADCPEGQVCIAKPGKKTGTCGTK